MGLFALIFFFSFGAVFPVVGQAMPDQDTDTEQCDDSARKQFEREFEEKLTAYFRSPMSPERRKRYDASWKCQMNESSLLDYREDSCIDKTFSNLPGDRSSRLKGKLFFIDDDYRYSLPWTHQASTKSLLDVLHPKGSTDFFPFAAGLGYSVTGDYTVSGGMAAQYRKTPRNSLVSMSAVWVRHKPVLVDGSLVLPYINSADLGKHGCLISTVGNNDDPLISMTSAERAHIKKVVTDENACVLFIARISQNQEGRGSLSGPCSEELRESCLFSHGNFTIPLKTVDGTRSYGNQEYTSTSSVAPYVAEVFARLWNFLPAGTDVRVARDIIAGCTFGFAGTAQAYDKVAGGRLSLECVREQAQALFYRALAAQGADTLFGPACEEEEQGSESSE